MAAGMTVAMILGASALSVGQASAATSWALQLQDKAIPSGTGSVRLTFPPDGGSTCLVVPKDAVNTPFNVRVNANQSFTVQAFGDTKCSGATTGGAVSYVIATDADVKENNGLTCQGVTVAANGASRQWVNCR